MQEKEVAGNGIERIDRVQEMLGAADVPGATMSHSAARHMQWAFWHAASLVRDRAL